jgi:hypothetical protein
MLKLKKTLTMTMSVVTFITAAVILYKQLYIVKSGARVKHP